jgi:uncharacterized membrane protein YoaK (UPF0700 family)
MEYTEIMLSGTGSISQFNSRNVAIWLAMAFQGGAINAGGFLACHRFVTHTTGFATYFGTEMAQANFLTAFGMLTVPLFFLFGAMASAYFVDCRLSAGLTPRYSAMFGLIAIAMLLIAAAGNRGAFGIFGETLNLNTDYVLLALLCLCSGIQNATITSASGAVIRTTHLTGVTTDLGIGLMRVLSSPRTALRNHELRANWMRAGLIFFFALGSLVSAILFNRYEYWAFLGPAFISMLLMGLTLRKSRNERSHARAS